MVFGARMKRIAVLASALLAFAAATAASERGLAPADVFVPTGLTSIDTKTAVSLPDGRVLIVCNNGTTAQLYDPTTHTIAATGPMNYARFECRATLLQDGTVLVTGGRSSGFFPDAWTAE